MMETRSALATVRDVYHSKESMVSLRLHWRLSSSLVVDREAAIKPKGYVARLFSEVGSSVDHRLLSPTAGLSLGLEDVAPACCCG